MEAICRYIFKCLVFMAEPKKHVEFFPTHYLLVASYLFHFAALGII